MFVCFVWFDLLRPINNLSVMKGRVFLGWTSTKLGLMFLLKDTAQWRRWGSNPRPLGSSQPIYHWASALPSNYCDTLVVWKWFKKMRPDLFAWPYTENAMAFLLVYIFRQWLLCRQRSLQTHVELVSVRVFGVIVVFDGVLVIASDVRSMTLKDSKRRRAMHYYIQVNWK